MPLKCKLVERNTDPTDKSSPKKWYGTTQSAAPLSGKAMTKAATKNTTLAPIELEAALDLLADFIPEQLLQGHTVTIPGLGYFRLTFRSKGADTVQEFNAKEMIYDVRPLFVPSAEFRNRIQEGIEFEDGGVSKDGVSYATRADFYQATGQGGTTTTPGTGEDDGDHQLG